MIARDQLKSVIDRILRLKEEQDTIGEDVREVYAEAKSNGYDKTALGRVVGHLRKCAKKGVAEVQEDDALFDLYLSAYEGPHTHAHARVGSVTEIGRPAQDVAPVTTAATAFGKRADGNTGGSHVGDRNAQESEKKGGTGEGLKAVPRDPVPTRNPQMEEDIPIFLRRAG